MAGGGARNGELVRLLNYHLRTEITTADAIGWSSAYLEAQAFAYLAVRSLHGLPITFPSTTGVREPDDRGSAGAAVSRIPGGDIEPRTR